MNTIRTVPVCLTTDDAYFPTLLVDDLALDQWLERHYPEYVLKELLPTLLPALTEEEGRSVVWQRLNAARVRNTVVPIMMDGDDLDLYCCVVVEMVPMTASILWKRMGIDWDSGDNMPYSVGTTVRWFEEFEPLEFDRQAHEAVVQVFSRYLLEQEWVLLSDAAQR